MDSLFNVNGLVFWSEREVKLRERFISDFAFQITEMLKEQNTAWEVVRFEGPILTPRENINSNYTSDDVWVQQADEETCWDPDANSHWYREDGDLVLRPETTPSSYVYAQHLLNTHTRYKAPLCVWQAGKSFRREQEQVTKNMRLKEFYQQEFQCIYSADTMNDYHTNVLEPVRKMIGEAVGLPTRIVESDRLPSYSETTMDIEVDNGDKWMEVVSISRRTDFPDTLKFGGKKGMAEKDALVLEIAIGLDRVVYCKAISNQLI